MTDARRFRLLRGLVSLGVLLLTTLACTTGNSPRRESTEWTSPPTSGGAEWTRVGQTSFGVLMPHHTQVQTEQRIDDEGVPIRTYSATARGSYSLFGFAVFEAEGGLTGDLLAALDECSTSFNEGLDGTVRRVQDGHEQGFPVRHVVLDMAEGGVMVQRHYVGLRRIYTFVAAFPSQLEEQNAPSVDYFMQSIQLDPNDAPSPDGNGQLALGADDWRWIYPPEADFAIRVPGAPNRTRAELAVDDENHPVTVYSVGGEEGPGMSVIVTTFGARPPEGIYQTMRERMERRGYHFEREADTQLQGYAGREMVFRSGDTEMRSRFFVTNSRLYEVRVELPNGADGRTTAARRRFFDSFRIL